MSQGTGTLAEPVWLHAKFMGLRPLDEGWIGNDTAGVETFGHGENGVIIGYFGVFVVAVGALGRWVAVVVAGVEIVESLRQGTWRRRGDVSSHLFVWLF